MIFTRLVTAAFSGGWNEEASYFLFLIISPPSEILIYMNIFTIKKINKDLCSIFSLGPGVCNTRT